MYLPPPSPLLALFSFGTKKLACESVLCLPLAEDDKNSSPATFDCGFHVQYTWSGSRLVLVQCLRYATMSGFDHIHRRCPAGRKRWLNVSP